MHRPGASNHRQHVFFVSLSYLGGIYRRFMELGENDRTVEIAWTEPRKAINRPLLLTYLISLYSMFFSTVASSLPT